MLLTWEYGEGILDGRHVDPPVVVFFHSRGTLFPVCVVFALVRRADEESSNVVLGRNHQETVVSVASDATALLSLSIGLVGRRKARILISDYPYTGHELI